MEKDRCDGMTKLLLIILALLILWALLGCQSIQPPVPQQEMKPSVSYRRDLVLEVNGETFVGYGVPKKADIYKINIMSPINVNLFRGTSCHRDAAVEEEGTSFQWTYRPVRGVEDGPDCILDISTYGKDGRHGFGSLDFESAAATLPATIYCNGDRDGHKGTTTICESKSGLTQLITFDTEVKADPDGACRTLQTTDNKTFKYTTPKAECTYFFCAKDGRCHKHTAFGYEDIPLRR